MAKIWFGLQIFPRISHQHVRLYFSQNLPKNQHTFIRITDVRPGGCGVGTNGVETDSVETDVCRRLS